MNEALLKKSLDKVSLMDGLKKVHVALTLVEEACILTQSKLSYFAVMNDAEDVLTMLNWSKTAMHECKAMDQPIVYPIEKTGLWGDCVRERKPVVTNDYKSLVKDTKKGYPAGHVDVVRHFNIPVTIDGKIKGVLGVGNKETDYTQDDVDTLLKFTADSWNIFSNAAD